MNTLAVWVISRLSHGHYQSIGELLTCLCLGFLPTQSGEPPLSLATAHCRQIHQCSSAQFSAESPKPSCPVAASNIELHRRGSWSRTRVGPEVPLGDSYSHQALIGPTVLSSFPLQWCKADRAKPSDLCSLNHNPHRASLCVQLFQFHVSRQDT